MVVRPRLTVLDYLIMTAVVCMIVLAFFLVPKMRQEADNCVERCASRNFAREDCLYLCGKKK